MAIDFIFCSNKPTVIGYNYEPSQCGSIIAIFLSERHWVSPSSHDLLVNSSKMSLIWEYLIIQKSKKIIPHILINFLPYIAKISSSDEFPIFFTHNCSKTR